jgi:hypothetical protein
MRDFRLRRDVVVVPAQTVVLFIDVLNDTLGGWLALLPAESTAA